MFHWAYLTLSPSALSQSHIPMWLPRYRSLRMQMRFLEELFCCGHFPHKQQPKFLLIIFLCVKEITEMLQDCTLIKVFFVFVFFKRKSQFFGNFITTITTSVFEFTAFELSSLFQVRILCQFFFFDIYLSIFTPLYSPSTNNPIPHSSKNRR